MRQLKSERDWLRNQVDGIGKELRAERKRNLKREDELTNQILRLRGGRDLPLRFDDDGSVKPIDQGTTAEGLTQAEDAQLRMVAANYCKSKFGDGFTEEEFEQTYDRMLLDPRDWLDN